jgi:hypothetical protein
MGDIDMDIDGYYKYWPVQKAGYWDAPPLRQVADILDNLNREWDEELLATLDELNRKQEDGKECSS